MKTMKTSFALWLASRAEASARTTRRALRDHVRRENDKAAHADKRARGLRLWAAWSRKDEGKSQKAKVVASGSETRASRGLQPLVTPKPCGGGSSFKLQPFPRLVRKAAA